MNIQQSIEAAYKQAFKASDRVTVSALRMLKSAIKNREIEVGHELTDPETVEVIGREAKRRRDAAGQYQAGNRPDLAAKETAEAALFAHYLPAQLSSQEVAQLVSEAVAATSAAAPADLGKVMGVLMPKIKGRADGAVVQAAVRKALGG